LIWLGLGIVGVDNYLFYSYNKRETNYILQYYLEKTSELEFNWRIFIFEILSF